jgi:hypothetical protein
MNQTTIIMARDFRFGRATVTFLVTRKIIGSRFEVRVEGLMFILDERDYQAAYMEFEMEES